jgi:hypothetical protein
LGLEASGIVQEATAPKHRQSTVANIRPPSRNNEADAKAAQSETDPSAGTATVASPCG